MKTKTKKKLIKLSIKLYVWLVAIFISSVLLDWTIYQIIFFTLDPVGQFEVAEVNIIRKAEAVEAKENMREWVLSEFKRNNLNPQIADCVINQESRWQDQAISPSREDFGLMQWHIQHIRSGFITPACAFDYKCSVKKAIKKLKTDGTWYDENGKRNWYGYKDANCQRLGKI